MVLETIKDLTSRDNGFYQRYYHYFIILLMALIVALISSVGFVMYQMLTRPLPAFNAKLSSGETMQLTSFDEPNLLPDTIINWATKAATLAYTFDFVNYNNEIQLARPYFTDAGWQDYLASVNDLISTIVKNQLFVNGVVAGTPVISNQGDLPGRGYTWRIQIPFMVTYQAAEVVTNRRYYVVITIVRVPTSVNPQGIGIDQFVMV